MRKAGLILLVIFIAGLAANLNADVVIKQKSTVETGAMMNAETEGTEYIKSDRSCRSSTTKMTGGMASMMGGAPAIETIEITRLDKNVMWNLNPEEKKYTEINLASLTQMAGQSDQAPGYQGMGNQSDYDWTVDVETSDDETTINGFKCKSIVGHAKGVNKEDAEDKMQLTYEYWYAEDVPCLDELKGYGNSLSNATGSDMMSSYQGAEQIFAQYGSQFDEMSEKMKEAEGYPIKVVILVESTKSMASFGGGQMPAGMEGMLGGMMGKGKKQSKGEISTVFSMTNEVQSIEDSDVDDSRFEIPEGYQKR